MLVVDAHYVHVHLSDLTGMIHGHAHQTLNGLLDAAIEHGPSGKNETLKLPTVITSGLKSMYNIASVWHTGTILMT